MDRIAQVNIGEAFFGGNHLFRNLSGASSLFTFILNLSFVLAGFLVLIIGIIGGLQVISGAGSGSPESAAKGKKALTSAVLGFIIIFTAYWLVRFIEVITGSNFFTEAPIN